MVGFAVAVSAFLFVNGKAKPDRFDVDFLASFHPVVLGKTEHREMLVFKNTSAKDLLQRIGNHWTGDGWRPMVHDSSTGGDQYIWRNKAKREEVLLSTGQVAFVNSMLSHPKKPVGPSDTLLDVMVN